MHAGNGRAQRFYLRHGFLDAGTFDGGAGIDMTLDIGRSGAPDGEWAAPLSAGAGRAHEDLLRTVEREVLDLRLR
ncbi:hypothetical protein GCM10009557_22040 [Virgisporangium ochraceum]